MIKNIFKKFKSSFSNKKREYKKEISLNQNNFKREHELYNKKSKTLKFEDNNYDLELIDKETRTIYDLFVESNSKINFFENLISNLKRDRKDKILNLKYKLQSEKSIT